MNKMKAALYVRVSTKYQVDKDSLPFQRKKLKEYCKMLDIHKYEIFEDDGYSAKNTERPRFQEMMNRVRGGEFTHLIVWKVDRISRNLLDFSTMYKELKDHRVTFISMNEQFDTSTAIGEAMLKIILIFAELERNMTSERVTGIMLDRAENGLWNGSLPPLGYKADPEKQILIPEPDEKEKVKMIFDLYEKLHSCRKVARFLQKSGIKPKYHTEWLPEYIRRTLRNEVYIGTYIYNRREFHGPERPKSEWIVKENNHPAIISPEQFSHCNEIMDKNASSRDVSQIRQTRHIHVFGGKVSCNLCGGNMNAAKDKQRDNGLHPSIYRCGRRARQMDCENKRMISDLSLGPFVFNYAANLARLQKDFKGIDSPEKLESALLSGPEFSGVRIKPESLKMTFSMLAGKNISKGAYVPDMGESDSTESISADSTELLKKEREKCKNAISRLTELYMFDPDALTKEEYSEKKRELTAKIRDIEKRISAASGSGGTGSDDLSFIKKASAFLVAQHISSKEHIDYSQIAVDLDAGILKDFVDQIIGEIFVQDGKIMRIRFASGLEHDFLYEE